MFVWVCIVFLSQVWSRKGRRFKGEGSRGEKRKNRGETKRRDDRGMDAQVLLLMDPGAELGWAVLSDTLPSCEAGDVCARA